MSFLKNDQAYAACPTPATISAGTFTILNGENCTIDASDGAFGFTDVVNVDGSITIESGGSLTITTTGFFLSSLNLTGVLTVEDGGTLTVDGGTSAMSVNDNGQLNIEDGGIVNVDGDFYAGFFSDGGADIDGQLNVGGDFNLTGSGTLTGDGEINADGDVNDGGGDSSGWQGDQTCNGGGTCDTLPVELISFTGQMSNNLTATLSWQTASEINNEGFYVEKSADGNSYNELGFVSGNGTTNEQQRYTYVDLAFSSSAYYRIRQVDYDGTTEIFDAIHIISQNDQVNIYPNPVYSYVNVSGPINQTYNMKLMDLSGNVLVRLNDSYIIDISAVINGQLSSLVPSVYILQLHSQSGVENLRFVKK